MQKLEPEQVMQILESKIQRNKRNGNLSNIGQSHNKSTNNYYTHRDNIEEKDETIDNRIFDDISGVQTGNSNENASKRHCESTKVSERKHFQNFYNPEGRKDQIIFNRNILNKHSALFINGSQTARNYEEKDENMMKENNIESSETSLTPSKSPSNISLSYHRKYKKQKKMKMMILKNGRIFNNKNKNIANKFHYFQDKSKRKLLKDTSTSNKKSLKNSKSRTRYAEYDEKDETIYDQIN